MYYTSPSPIWYPTPLLDGDKSALGGVPVIIPAAYRLKTRSLGSVRLWEKISAIKYVPKTTGDGYRT
jgi:hypothetical protein